MEIIDAPSQEPKSNRNLIIGIVIAIVLCCCCATTAIAGYYGYQAYLKAQEAINQVQDFEIPTSVPLNPSDPNSPNVEIPGLDINSLPKGGLADDTTRYTAWLSVQLVSAMSGCESPSVEATTITVAQQPDSKGEWKEDWKVSCGNGSSQTVRVVFTPENGVVNVNVEMP
ncbi:MAG: hypothetical protein U0Z26_12035 [Anaerolineales bacterium]